MDPRAAHPRPEDDDPPSDDAPVALTPDEARAWRLRHPSLSPWRVVAVQALGGLALALGVWVVSGRLSMGWSVAYGAICVVIPAALFAHGVSRAARRGSGLGWMGWEVAKLALAIALLVLAPRLVSGLSWLALLAGMVVTMKLVWIALWVHSRSQKS